MASLSPARQRGFSLLEVLVAFSILALALGVLLRIFGGNGQLAGQAEERSRAIVLAQSLLAQAGVETPLQPGQTSGSSAQFEWAVVVTPFTPPGEPLPEQPFKPFWVEAVVEWGEGRERHSFNLATLRIAGTNQNQPNSFGGGGGLPRR